MTSIKLSQTLLDFIDLLNAASVKHALIGGLAVGYWAEERFTRDADLTIALTSDQWTQLETRLKSEGDVKIDQVCLDEESHLPYLIRLHYRNLPIDLIVSLTDFQVSLLSRAVDVSFFGKKLYIASPEDIIVAKLIAHRSQDLVDIENILVALSDLDLDYIARWAQAWEVDSFWQALLDRENQ